MMGGYILNIVPSPHEAPANTGVGRASRPLVARWDPYISVVIPTYGRRDRLLECLCRLACCDGVRAVEVIVVEQGATEREVAVANCLGSSIQQLKYIELSVPNVSAARNRGALRAKGEVILFLDDDIELERGYRKRRAVATI
jgi:glycosyltransferase involved in cell wall biosynthesis